MKQYAGSYSKYMNSGSASSSAQSGNSAEFLVASADQSSTQGGYDKYMKQYAGGAGADGKQGGYEQYMKQYAGGQGADGKQGNYEQYMKQYAGSYTKYMNSGSASSSAQ